MSPTAHVGAMLVASAVAACHDAAMVQLDQMTDSDLRACLVSSNYPLVQCSHSGQPLPGYIICIHAIVEPDDLTIEHAGPTKVGKVTCRACSRSSRLFDLRTACAHYVRDHFAVLP